ncbi:response regulator [Variovorax sp. RCC_210]|uniref:response regulator n=1 Tax=Variovorax sp. RCC_210 TaxID=3239217 RepID=UPI000D5DA4AD
MVIHALLVEDNKVIRDNLIPTLEALSEARVEGVAETEAEAIAWLESHDGWDVAVVDLFLREGSGLGVLASCANRRAGQRVVIFSNYATEEIRRRANELGADAIFDKSTEIDGLLDFLERLPPPP